MSKPIFHTSDTNKISGVKADTRDLYRRPAPTGGGIVGGFLVYPTSDTTLASATFQRLVLAGSHINQGSVYTTADDELFDLIDGLWLIGAQTFWHPNASAPTADGAVHHIVELTSGANPDIFATQYSQPGRDGGGSTSVDFQLTTTFLAITSGFPGNSLLSLTATNSSNGSQKVKSREDRTFLWGVCLTAT